MAGVVYGCQKPRLHLVDGYERTEGARAAALSALSGVKPYPWQSLVLDDWMAVDERGCWVHPTCGLLVRRQSGKSQLLLMRVLWGLVKGERVLFTAHRADTVRDLFVDLVKCFDEQSNPDLAPYLKFARLSNGQQEVVTTTGGHLWAGTRAGFGRGKRSIDLVIIDEAQAYNDVEQADLEPTMTNSPNAQVILTGTPPTKGMDGGIFRTMRARALVKKAPGVCWHEWSAEPKDDGSHLDDPEAYRQAAPSMGYSNLTMERMQAERVKYVDHLFESECLGIIAKESHAEVIPLDVFRALADESSTPVTDLCLGVDMNRDRDRASISIAGLREDGVPHIELVAHTGMPLPDGSRLEGVDWLADTIVQILQGDEFKAVVIDAMNPAMSIVDELKRSRVRVTITQTIDVLVACARLYDGAMNGALRHIGQEALVGSLASAKKSPLRNGWKLAPADEDSDITGIFSAVLALWAATTAQRTKRPLRRQTQTERERPPQQAPMFA